GPPGRGEGGYFLCFGALAPYKRIDLAIDAFREFPGTLWVAGAGQDAERLSRSLPPNVKMVGNVSDEELPALYRGARALIFPGVEDFGLTPIEAQASGRPVIAFAAGGALETLSPDTAIYFERQSRESLLAALRTFDGFERTFDPERARAQALEFSRAAFFDGIRRELARL
ncbi:MAG: glycosyltransferase, partial [Myxococcaceae bacterium]